MLFSRKPDFEIVDMTTEHTADASQIHGDRFRRQWTDGEFHALIVQPTVFGFIAKRADGARSGIAGFVLARVAADEAEILSIAVARHHERTGLGWRLMLAAIRQASSRGATSMFLEVDEANSGAIALYRRLGFVQAGERRAYYGAPGQAKSSALVLKLDLS